MHTEPIEVALAAGRAKAIPLTKGQVAYVDTEDYAAVVAAGPWRVSTYDPKTGAPKYARTGGHAGKEGIDLHRFIFGCKKGEPGPDHCNGNGFDNRKANLRPATYKENAANRGKPSGRSLYKGVIRRAAHPGVYFVEVREGRHGQFYFQGRFTDEVEAARAFDREVRKHKQGEFQRFNFPRPGERGLDGELVPVTEEVAA